MKTTNTKKLAILLTLTTLMSTPAFAKKGGDSGGGGDAEEARVNEIRTDILSWIAKGGARELALPSDISLGEYEDKMSSILEKQKVAIAFTDEAVKVKGVEKTCRGAFVVEKGLFSDKKSNPQILCNLYRFKNTEESKQYPLIHHEYAGLVNIEKNDGAASDYEISNQITDFLETKTVKRLAVKKKPVIKPVDTTLVRSIVKSAETFKREETLPECRAYHAQMEKDQDKKIDEITTLYMHTVLDDFYVENKLAEIENIKLVNKTVTTKGNITEIRTDFFVNASTDSTSITLVQKIEGEYKIKYNDRIVNYVDKLGRTKRKVLECTTKKDVELVYDYYRATNRPSHVAAIYNTESNHRLNADSHLNTLMQMAYETIQDKIIELK